MTQRTQHPTTTGSPLADDPTTAEALRRALAAPTLAARLATHTARYLDTVAPTRPVTALAWSEALRRAHLYVLPTAPDPVANAAWARVLGALPELRQGETGGEYALRLRDAAKGL
ncbi:hypothetical protein ACLIYP_05510 [Streptomyces nanhaiensis]|uniref:hypothetical protein n=1 Tax=Streptomyces nanhaiensis TaxID=679319 RepID=UPI00399CEBAF